ncbi:MAG TPA: hypothetical protein VKT32_03995, partial [Chthonomonadaceae bacterium]|nr:hypothetical protein [Chthonomonadaceae bacterium]
MTSEDWVLLLTFALGIAPLAAATVLLIRRAGFVFWLISPLPAFCAAYSLCFLVRPFLEVHYGIKYDFTTFRYDSFV